ncbi:non-ribosomal peptide synthetase, partial [Lonsdalea populi]|uniref:non-ribosomal peptide synthetase n=1 Tax=Lonsdalea populi TaxID=1172565 RepID=UPI001160DC72
FFANTLALRCRIADNMTVGELLAQVKATTLAAQAHQDLPFEQLVEALNPVRSLAHSPLFQTMMVWQEDKGNSLALQGLKVAPFIAGQVTAKFDLLLALEAEGDRIEGCIEYASSLFDPETATRYIGYLQRLLQALVEDEAQEIVRLPLLSDAERQQVLYGWNDTRADYPQEQGIHQLFEAQVRRTPQAVALVYNEQQLSYDALNQHANRLAHVLISQGVVPDTRVAICLPRGLQSVVAVLAVLKAGGAYLPIDPAYPDDRIRYLLHDGQPRVLITDASLSSRLPTDEACKLLLLPERLIEDRMQPLTDNPASPLNASQLAYVIYTSGSTGQPKGVAMPHRALVNLMHWQRQMRGEKTTPRTLQYAAMGFDVSFQEIFSTLLFGGELVLIDEASRLDMVKLSALIRQRQIARLYLPYVALKALAAQLQTETQPLDSLREIITAGEQLVITPMLQQAFIERLSHVRLYNHYGPTETHVVSCFDLPSSAQDWGRLPPIGRPIANTRVYLLDALQQPVPVGVSGEIYLAGDAVACGYLNHPALTAERFLPDPFVPPSRHTLPQRMYRTGDIGRWNADGTIAYLGRGDRQVKVRGFRVELEEIEAQLNTCPGIAQSLVVLKEEDPDNRRLVAYFLPNGEEGASCQAETLHHYLAGRLPEYMVPIAYVPLNHFPVSPNGKLDRSALPAPDAAAYVSQEYEPPQGEIEQLLADIWRELLHVERVGRQDHFFLLGGHSLLAVQLVSRIKNRLMIEVPLQDVFAAPQLQRMADLLLQHIDMQLQELMSKEDSFDQR